MCKLRPTFSLRWLLLVIGIVALCLGYWRRSQDLRNQAAEYHLEALRTGYLAVAVQKPQSADWETGWRKTHKWPAPLAMDRESVSHAVSLWQKSKENASKSEYCLLASSRPWLLWSSPIATTRLTPLPSEDDELGSWWDAEIAPHVEVLGLDHAYGWSSGPGRSHLERDCVFQNGADQRIRRKFNVANIRSFMPVEDGINDEAEQSHALEPAAGPDFNVESSRPAQCCVPQLNWLQSGFGNHEGHEEHEGWSLTTYRTA